LFRPKRNGIQAADSIFYALLKFHLMVFHFAAPF
jgi:hypothetical protein